jgi:poly(3-hydroxyalkanoate) depolymerase
MFTTASLRSVAVGDQVLRTSVRPGRTSIIPGRGRWASGDGASGDGASGRAGRTPLLLINGIGASLELLEPFVDALDPTIEVIRFDVPGVGGSPLPARPYRFTGLCALIGRMLTELGYDTVDVLGISWGGGVAQHFAAVQRPRCRRLVLVSTATGALMVPAKPSVLAKMVTPRRYTDRGYLEHIAATIYGGSARTDPASVTAVMNAHNRVGSPRGYLYQLAAGAGWTSLPFLPLLTQPTLIVAGTDDPIIPLVNARLMRRLIPDSTLHVFDGGHLGLVTEAAELAPVISQFLTAPEPATNLGSSNPKGDPHGSGRRCRLLRA